jgi:hypothetical protein
MMAYAGMDVSFTPSEPLYWPVCPWESVLDARRIGGLVGPRADVNLNEKRESNTSSPARSCLLYRLSIPVPVENRE